MKGSQEKPDRFSCTSCGLCCKNITGIIELIGFDAGNGVCKFLDLETNLCKIYESRPLICRVDEAHKKLYSHLICRVDEAHKKLYSHIPLKEFYAKNAEVCNALQEANHMDKSFRVILNQ
ncbi:YkgJ family cysteine cluster protein [Helicobacter pylori]|nr:YkgJ family cysteine cluster protein [Helicobacter pylori]